MVYSPCYPFVERMLSHETISRLYMANDSESNTGQLLRTDEILIHHFITAFQSFEILPHRSTSSAVKSISGCRWFG